MTGWKIHHLKDVLNLLLLAGGFSSQENLSFKGSVTGLPGKVAS